MKGLLKGANQKKKNYIMFLNDESLRRGGNNV